MRHTTHIDLPDPEDFKYRLLTWAGRHPHFLWLDSNSTYNAKNHSWQGFDAVLAVGVRSYIKCRWEGAFDRLKNYRKERGDWLFGYLGYDLKNDTEALTSENFDGLHFPDLYFFQPQKLFFIRGNSLETRYTGEVADQREKDLSKIKDTHANPPVPNPQSPIPNPRISKETYVEHIATLQRHIRRGDIYEVNFCQEFYAEGSAISPPQTFLRLNELSRSPFAAFLRLEDKYLMSASPERYLSKAGEKVMSQPIKGTARRSGDEGEDRRLAEVLQNDPKERAENIMITDLVRHDLSRTASKGSVQVRELCKLCSFKQAHQLISTITSKVSAHVDPVEILQTTFPMGSMTGAPKISAMKIIERQEYTKRGLFSGAVGFFSPEGDFDFNVVIRSILYNEANKYLSFSTGGAITAKSIAEKEYEECLVKAKALFESVSP